MSMLLWNDDRLSPFPMEYVNNWTWVFSLWSCGLAVCSVRDEMIFQSDAITPRRL
jgi:hypothetical protein